MHAGNSAKFFWIILLLRMFIWGVLLRVLHDTVCLERGGGVRGSGLYQIAYVLIQCGRVGPALAQRWASIVDAGPNMRQTLDYHPFSELVGSGWDGSTVGQRFVFTLGTDPWTDQLDFVPNTRWHGLRSGFLSNSVVVFCKLLVQTVQNESCMLYRWKIHAGFTHNQW